MSDPLTMRLWISFAIAICCFVLRARALSLKDAIRGASDAELDEMGGSVRPEKRESLDRIRHAPAETMAALGTVALCATVAGGASAVYGATTLCARLFPEGVLSLSHGLRQAAIVLLSLFASIAAAGLPEAVFRSLAKARPTKTALRSVGRLALLTRLASPPISLAGRFVRLCLRPFGVEARFQPSRPPLEELERMLAEAAKGKGLSRQAPRLIHNIFEMNDRIARDIIVPRTQVMAMDIATPPAEMVRILSEQGHSRIPVYKDDIDNVVGILHVRDLVPMLQCPELIVIQDVVRPALFVPWSKPVGDLLRVMQKKRIHMAIVVDEYGGFLGVATLEDLLETIVGEIRNEYASDGPEEIERLGDGTYRIRGEASVASVEEKLGVRFAVEEPCETMAGLVSYLSGCIPEAGERIFVGGCMLTVEERSVRRVSRIRCQRVSIAPGPASKPD